MKKFKNSFYIILFFALVVMATNFIGTTKCDFNTQKANASTIETTTITKPDENQLGAVVPNDKNGIDDNVLYQSLINVYNLTYKEFIDAGELSIQSQLKVKMLKDIKVIDLENQSIYSIAGLKYLDLGKLEILNLGQNNITEIKTEDIKDLYSLKHLGLHFNEISTFTIPKSLTNLNYLNLNKNYIDKLDISMLNVADVYLSFNKFITIKNLTLPRVTSTTKLYVQLFNNNIVDGDEAYLNNGVQQIGGQISIDLAIQGVGLNQRADIEDNKKVTPNVSRDNNIKFYNVDKYNLKVRIYDPISNTTIKTIANNDETTITEFILPVGEYKLEYLNADNDEILYERNDEFLCAFKEMVNFNIVPKTPTVKFLVDGKEYNDYGKFTSWNAKLVATNNDDIGKMYYSVAGGEWVEGNSVNLKRGGQYTVSFKCVYADGIESQVVAKQVYMSMNPYIPDAIMILIIGVVILLLFFVCVPLIKKYLIKK